MGILSRFADIMNANINALLSKSEAGNADKLLEKYLQDAKENLGQVKAETAAVIAEEIALARKLSENDEACKRYDGYSEAAVKSGNDDDARKFLIYKSQLVSERDELAAQYGRAKENSEKMRQMTSKLMSDIEVSQAKLDELKQKLTIAKQREKLNKINEKISQSPLNSFDNLFDTVQKRVDTAEAAASLNVEMSQNTKEIESLAQKYDAASQKTATETVEEQLARLKASLRNDRV